MIKLLKATVALGLLALIGVGSFFSLAAFAPLKSIEIVPVTETVTEGIISDSDVYDLLGSIFSPTAASWLETDTTWGNTTESFPLASISKMITVLVCLEEQPQSADLSSWGELHWTYDDWLRSLDYQAIGGVAYPIPPDSFVSLRDVFTLIFLPSANDYAAAYAYSIFGSNDAFVRAVDDWAIRHGFSSVQMVEPTGMDSGNRASPEDLVKIAKLALQDPVITQFTNLQEADIDFAGLVTNTNPLLTEDSSVIGLKTGRTLEAGFNLLIAATQDLGEREVTRIAMTMGRESLEARAQSGREMLAFLATMPRETEIVSEGTVYATVTTWQGDTVNLITQSSLSHTLLPAEIFSITSYLENSIEEAPLGTELGHLEISTPLGVDTIALITDAPILEPDLTWRLKNPMTVIRSFFE